MKNKELNIKFCDDYDLVITNRFKELSFTAYKNDDNVLEIRMDDGDHITMILTKDQVPFLIDWLNKNCLSTKK